MAALLRSGKFLRVVSGFARSPGPAFTGNNAGPTADTANAGYHLVVNADAASPFQSWSLGQIQSSLPVITAAKDHGQRDEDQTVLCEDGPLFLMSNDITQAEIKELLAKIPELDPKVAHSQSILVLRLCGSVLAHDLAKGEDRTAFANEVWTQLEEEMKVPMTIQHYNALLSVYLENDHTFCPAYFQNRLRNRSVRANQETFEALMRRYSKDGNMEGASRILKVMQERGFGVSRSAFHALINGHAQANDFKSAKQVLNTMAGLELVANSETFLILANGFARYGDFQGIQDTFQEAVKHKVKMGNKHVYEVIWNLCEHDHKNLVFKVLDLANRDSESFGFETKAVISKLIASSHDDVAFSLLKFIPQAPKDVSKRATEFLDELVKKNRPVSKLLWYAEEMKREKILEGGLETLLLAALNKNNFSLALKLAEIYVQDGHPLSKQITSSLFTMCGSSLDVLSTAKAIGTANLTGADLKSIVIPHVDKMSHSVTEITEHLQTTGLEPQKFISPLIDYLLEKNRHTDAEGLAQSHQKFLSSAHADLFKPSISETTSETGEVSQSPVAPCIVDVSMVQMFDPATNTFQWFPLPYVCDMFRTQGRFWDLEQMLVTSRGNFKSEDRKIIYLATLQSYLDHGFFDKVIFLTHQLETEEFKGDFPQYDDLMNQLADVMAMNHNQFAPENNTNYLEDDKTQVKEESRFIQSQHRNFKRALGSKSGEEALQVYYALEKAGKILNITESSSLIELLVRENQITEAAQIAETMLSREMYPLPKIFRFLLNKMAASGHVEPMESLGQYLSAKVKKDVSYDNRLCNAYLSASRGGEFLDKLHEQLELATPENIQTIKDKFPRGGAMGLLENYPELIGHYSKLAHKFIQYDYIAPMNVLWTYHFINGRHDLAAPLWENYVKNCPQIMFQKICQTARSQGSLDMAFNLVTLLQDAKVTIGAQGIAYSCLLDVLSQKNLFKDGLSHLNEALQQGVHLDDVNRTALVRLKSGLESIGEKFPYEVPKKCNNLSSENERSLSPAMDN
ncbi:hypothetical protein TCAL_02200 [Tigriopus californicus]|uniref:Pentacotripeptide-repeat region of PRORP domain-containing protein n=1 Tax=Tigriopus californicus TaxID=6832 RepID=A0A553P6W9_TIGCA|nr:leucine-rich PPR motif-containing protein, mitochondrial-like [Tigriopus californicus]TRY73427.1 hypothetical protein TCAL_02200 [Tigriopus californicus]|eukprot:TCALIF_02200-PA protein Name:"Similar to lrpprc Leucine-rich PPR motif-containing protein, mitochondrial (Xenopus tropicalis)" AED:0.17 eAED:0.22 QI:0/0/0/1/1/1/2/0/1024